MIVLLVYLLAVVMCALITAIMVFPSFLFAHYPVKLHADGMNPVSLEVIGYVRYLHVPPLDKQWSAIYKIHMEDGSDYWTTLQPRGTDQYPEPYHTFLSNTPIVPEQETRPMEFPEWLRLVI